MCSCAIWAASSIAPCVIRMRRCVSSPYWERAFSQNCTYARCILGNALHSRSVWSSWESSCSRAPTNSVHSLPRACRVVLNFEFSFAVSVTVFRLISMSPAKSKNGTESGDLPEWLSLVGWFAIFPTFVLHEEGRETYADGRSEGMLCRPAVFFATVLFRVQALRDSFCSFLSARFSDSF